MWINQGDYMKEQQEQDRKLLSEHDVFEKALNAYKVAKAQHAAATKRINAPTPPPFSAKDVAMLKFRKDIKDKK